jgi:hypothetical protein
MSDFYTEIFTPPPFLAPLPQHLAFALTEPTFGKKAQGQDAGLGMGAGGKLQRGIALRNPVTQEATAAKPWSFTFFRSIWKRSRK